jgi:hypothetical protein
MEVKNLDCGSSVAMQCILVSGSSIVGFLNDLFLNPEDGDNIFPPQRQSIFQ